MSEVIGAIPIIAPKVPSPVAIAASQAIEHRLEELDRSYPKAVLMLCQAIERIDLAPGNKLTDGAHGEYLDAHEGTPRIVLPAELKLDRSPPSPGGRRVEAEPSIPGVLDHEVGHAIEQQFAEEVRALHDPDFDLGRLYRQQHRSRMVKGVSSYVRHDAHEWFAESFAAWAHPAYPSAGYELCDTLVEMLGLVFGGPFARADAVADEGAPWAWADVVERLIGPFRRRDPSEPYRHDAWSEADHPRVPKGSPDGGQFLPHKGYTLSDLKKVGGQLGSNPGGQYETPDGKKLYVKFQKSDDHAKNEQLAARLYEATGAASFQPEMVDLGKGKLGTATEWAEGVKQIDPEDAEQVKQAQENFAIHAWLANWDAAGLTFDNQGMVGDKMTTLDVGGSLLYRAQGTPKGDKFGTEVGEWDTLRDEEVNPQNAKIFGGMTDEELKASAAKVVAIPDSQIKALVDEYGPGDDKVKAKLAETLIARKQSIADKVGLEVPPEAPDDTPEGLKLPEPEEGNVSQEILHGIATDPGMSLDDKLAQIEGIELHNLSNQEYQFDLVEALKAQKETAGQYEADLVHLSEEMDAITTDGEMAVADKLAALQALANKIPASEAAEDLKDGVEDWIKIYEAQKEDEPSAASGEDKPGLTGEEFEAIIDDPSLTPDELLEKLQGLDKDYTLSSEQQQKLSNAIDHLAETVEENAPDPMEFEEEGGDIPKPPNDISGTQSAMYDYATGSLPMEAKIGEIEEELKYATVPETIAYGKALIQHLKGGGDKKGAEAKKPSKVEIPDPPSWLGKSGQSVQQAMKAWQEGEAPTAVATMIINAAAKHTHPHSATYANKMLALLEGEAGLPKGSLGKAYPKGKGPAVKPGAPLEAASVPQAAKAPEPEKAAPAASGAPLNEQITEVVGGNLPVAEKLKQLKALQGQIPPNDTTLKGFADQWASVLGTAAGIMPQTMSAKPQGPLPHEGSTPQKQLHEIATGTGTPGEKIAALKAHTTVANFPTGYAAKFAAEWIKALGGDAGNLGGTHTSTTPASAPPPKPPPVSVPTKKAPHYKTEATHYFEDASGNEIKATFTADTKKIPDHLLEKLTEAYGGDPDKAPSPKVTSLMDEAHKMTYDALPASQKDAISQYQGSAYDPINDHLRGVSTGSAATLNKIASIRKALQTATVPVDTPAWRGLRSTLKELSGFDDPDQAIGRCFVHKNFASVSRSEDTARSFGEQVMMRVTVPAGSPGIVVGQQDWEQEIVLPDSGVFRIDKLVPAGSHSYKGAKWVAHVTLLGYRNPKDS